MLVFNPISETSLHSLHRMCKIQYIFFFLHTTQNDSKVSWALFMKSIHVSQLWWTVMQDSTLVFLHKYSSYDIKMKTKMQISFLCWRSERQKVENDSKTTRNSWMLDSFQPVLCCVCVSGRTPGTSVRCLASKSFCSAY